MGFSWARASVAWVVWSVVFGPSCAGIRPPSELLSSVSSSSHLFLAHPAETAEEQRQRISRTASLLRELSKAFVGAEARRDRWKVLKDEAFSRLTAEGLRLQQGQHVGQLDASSGLAALRALAVLGPVGPVDQGAGSSVGALAHTLVRQVTAGRGEGLRPSDISGLHWACCSLGLEDMARPLEPFMQPLPFRVLPSAAADLLSLDELHREVPFKEEMIKTKSGKQVRERRQTCWMADEGIGGFAYSGKIMAPTAMSPGVGRLRDALYDAHGLYFDCALLNLYPDGESACAWHSDPEHGTFWGLDSIIVSIGETRRFQFRSLEPQEQQRESAGATDEAESPHSFHLFDGDCVWMFGDCQDRFQHCVLKSEGSGNLGPRASIVFKRSLPNPGGKRGHGLPQASQASQASQARTGKSTKSTPKDKAPAPGRRSGHGSDGKTRSGGKKQVSATGPRSAGRPAASRGKRGSKGGGSGSDGGGGAGGGGRGKGKGGGGAGRRGRGR